MSILDIFNQDPFSAISLTQAVQRDPFMPTGLGELGIFEPDPIRTTALSVEERQGKLTLIPLSQRGTQGTSREAERRKMRYFDVPRLMHEDTIFASELQNIREFGTESVLMQVQTEVARRLSGPTGLLANIEYTKEYLRLGALQGKMLDPKNGSVLYDWYDEFEIAVPAEYAFNLAAGTPNSIRPIVNGIVRKMARAAQGAFTPQTRVFGMCGDDFYDQFANHPDVIRTFLNFQDAREIRGGSQGAAFSAFDFAGVTWFNYRGSDDNTTIKVAADKVKFFPVGAPGVFREAMAPGESIQWVNTPGQPVYVLPVPDRDRQMWWKMEVYAYPLFICTRPEVLLAGRAGA